MEKNLRIENAVIKSANIINGDTGFILKLSLTMHGATCDFGGYTLGSGNYPEDNIKIDKFGNYMAYYVASVLKTVGVDDFNTLNGKPVRVVIDDNLCVGIMNYLDNSNVFIPRVLSDDFDSRCLKEIMEDFQFEKVKNNIDKMKEIINKQKEYGHQ